jgi:taurine dioxygenase
MAHVTLATRNSSSEFSEGCGDMTAAPTVTLNITRLGVALGAVAHGVQLSESLSDEIRREIEDAIFTHQVVIFPEQNLTEAEQLNLADQFGVLRPPEPQRLFGEENPLQTFERNATSPPTTDMWHTDITFRANPPMLGVLSAVIVPSIGGDTAWVSMYSLYDSLSKPMQALCEQLSGIHTIDAVRPFIAGKYGEQAAARLDDEFPPRLHPLVQVHPRTGRKHLYIGGTWMPSIAELTPAESNLLLGYLDRGMDDINIQFRWRWSPGDVVIWDQRSAVHRGLSDHAAVDPNRKVRSIFVDGNDGDTPRGVAL